MKMERAFSEVADELVKARDKFPSFNSRHEGYAVLKEEVDELWEEIKNNTPAGTNPVETVPLSLQKEAVQTAAMALRFLMDCC